MRKCPCPVWIVKPGQAAKISCILAAIDTSSQNGNPDALNVKVMDLATSLARFSNSELHIVHAWELEGRDLETMESETTPKIREEIMGRNDKARRKDVHDLIDRYDLDDIAYDVHVDRGLPEYLLPKIAEEQRIDVVVMGTIRRTGIAGFFIGSTAELVLRQLECGVLAVKPDNFVTPVVLSNRLDVG
jgi:nucleotide-binding universal stress UspA family protein